MFRTCLLLYSVPVVIGIIVTDPPPAPTDYKYSYNIEDPRTGDSKSQHEVRRGDIVTGAYSVVDPNGTKRIVEYTADAKHGFQAVVREEPVEVQQSSPATVLLQKDNSQYNFVPRLTGNERYISSSDAVSTIPYSKSSWSRAELESADPAIYFTPTSEIKPENVPFAHGQYFAPV